jgi:hypothetical protein
MQDYRNLQVWQKAHKLAMDTYAVFCTLQDTRGVAPS